MISTLANRPALGFALGVALVIAALLHVAHVGATPATIACQSMQIALEDGYGVAGLRPICAR